MRKRPDELLIIGDDTISGWQAYDLPGTGDNIYVRRQVGMMNFKASYETTTLEIHGEPTNDPEAAVIVLIQSHYYEQRHHLKRALEVQNLTARMDQIEQAWSRSTPRYQM